MKATKVTLSGIALALGAAVVAFMFAALGRSESEACSPTAIRPWAADAFDARVAPGAAKPWPTLSGSAPYPPSSATKSAGSISVMQRLGSSSGNIGWEFFERTEVGPSMGTSLPHAPTSAVELLYWRLGAGPWLSPADGLPVDPQPSWSTERAAAREVSFILKASGDAFRFHGASLFDRTTKVKLSSSSSWGSTGGQEGEIRINISAGLKHIAHLLLEVPITYGVPEVKELALAAGETLRFGSHAEAHFLARGPGVIRESGTTATSRGGEDFFRFDHPGASGEFGWAVLRFYPRGLAAKFQALVPGGARWTALHGGSQFPQLERIPAAVETIKLRYLPHAARLQFSLPLPSTVPLAKDLLDIELGDVTIKDQWDVESVLTQTLQLHPQSVSELQLESLSFPITLGDATPRDFLHLIRDLLDPRARISTPEYRLRVQRTSGFQRFQDWISNQARRLGL